MPEYIKREIRARNTDYKNTCNCYWLAPFRYDKEKEILYLTNQEASRIRHTDTERIIQEEFKHITVLTSKEFSQLELEPLTPDEKPYQIVYLANLKMTNAEYWYRFLPNAAFCRLSDEESDKLLKGDYSKAVVERLTGCLEEVGAREAITTRREGKSYFVKTGTCSTKHNYPPQPVITAEDALNHLLGSNSVRQSLQSKRAQGILVQPWKKDVTPNNEFRVFVRSGVVTGVSQQFLYEVYPMMQYWSAEEIITCFQKLWDSLKEKMDHAMVYRDATFDGYVTTNLEGDLEAHLIELNSSALEWGPAGSALFEWENDPPPKVGEAKQFRITV